MKQLSDLTLADLVGIYNAAVEDYAPEGHSPVRGFKSKSAAVEKIESMCSQGNLAVSFDGDTAVVVDATPGKETPPGDLETVGDQQGDVSPSGFRRASGEWLKSHARGTAEREAYRAARRRAARAARRARRPAEQSAD